MKKEISYILLGTSIILASGCASLDKKEPKNPTEISAAYIARKEAQENKTPPLKSTKASLSEIYTQMAITYLRAGDPKQAILSAEKAVKEPGNKGMAYNIIGLSYQYLGDPQKAEPAFQKAIDESPQNPVIGNNYGAFLIAQKKYRKAITVLKKVTENALYKSPEIAWTNLAVSYHALGETEKAKAALDRALYFSGSYAPALQIKATWAYQEKNYLEALQSIRMVTMQENRNPAAWLLQGKAEKHLGNDFAAKKDFEKAIVSAPYSPEAKSAQKELLEMN